MSAAIPFVNTRQDLSVLRETQPDIRLVRTTLIALRNLTREDFAGLSLWVDPAADGLLRREDDRSPALRAVLEAAGPLSGLQDGSPEIDLSAAGRSAAAAFAARLLDSCLPAAPEILSVPQLPHGSVPGHSRVNAALAAGAREWREKSGFTGRLVLPVILTGRLQYALKKDRDHVTTSAARALGLAGAAGYWLVDSNLQDQLGQGNFPERFARLAALHGELNARIGHRPELAVAGPYWCLALVLWTRGLATHFGTGLGGTYQYHIPGLLHAKTARVRAALEPLLRTATVTPSLRAWLEAVVPKLAEGEAARASFESMLAGWDVLQTPAAARLQVARFHRGWTSRLEAAPEAERAVALYRMLSDAYVLGRRLPDLETERAARRPEQVAVQHMLNCL